MTHLIQIQLLYKTKLRGVYDMSPDFFRMGIKSVVDSWKFSMLLLYILWDDRPIFMISGSNEQLQQQLEHNQLKPDCYNCYCLRSNLFWPFYIVLMVLLYAILIPLQRHAQVISCEVTCCQWFFYIFKLILTVLSSWWSLFIPWSRFPSVYYTCSWVPFQGHPREFVWF